MSPQEIVASFREAKNKPEQIKILADLNDCSVKDIQNTLMNSGYSEEDVRLRKKKAPPKVYSKPSNTSRVPSALAVLSDELARLKKRTEEIPEQIQALQAEYEKIEGKQRAIRTAIETLAAAID